MASEMYARGSHVYDLLPVCSALGYGRTFKRWGLVERSKATGGVYLGVKY